MKFLPVRSSTLRPGIKLGFGVHLHIAGKYLLYVRPEDYIDKTQFEKLYFKNIRQVFVREEDMGAYKDFVKQFDSFDPKDPAIPLDEKALIVTSVSKSAVEDMYADPSSQENYKSTEKAAHFQVDLLMSSPKALEQLLNGTKLDTTTFQHSVNVATIAIGLSAWMGATEEICQAIGLGALLHDVGKAPEINVYEPLNKMTADAQGKYKQHPRLGAELLADKKYVSKEVLDIILLHEERLDGRGYPAGVKRLDQIFQVVGLANYYDREVTLYGRNPKEVYDELKKLDPAPYDPDMIDGLQEVLIANKILPGKI